MKTSDKIYLSAKDRVVGKWNRHTYEVIRRLGEGANGQVYLVKRGLKEYAMKIAHDPLLLQSEVNALQALQQAGSHSNFFVEADDAIVQGKRLSFYIMKYVDGSSMTRYLDLHGVKWFDIVARGLLERLHELHRIGFIFGDVKREHIQVSGYGIVQLVDYGGLTRKGKAVRQFTEIYDRGYWQAGSRKADEGYDLFSFAVLCIQCLDPDKELVSSASVLPQHRSTSYLKEMLQRCPMRASLRRILEQVIDGKMTSSQKVLQAWRRSILQTENVQTPFKETPTWLVRWLLVMMCIFAISVYWTFQ